MKKKFFVSLISIFLFLILDYFISLNTNLFNIRKDCFNFVKKTINNKNYFYYNLKKKCFAIEHKGVSGSYNVYTSQFGSRVKDDDIISNTSKEKIIFLGDSFTYGFGVNYEESIPGLIDKKTKNQYEIINFGFMGYSPSMGYYLLKNYINNFPTAKIKKVIYILDITDVHDEANRWTDIEGIEEPVILEKSTENQIKQNFDFRDKFRATRYIAYYVNKNTRNIKKRIKKTFMDESDTDKPHEPMSYWAKFIYTSDDILYTDKNYLDLWLNDKSFGIKKIKNKILKISDLLEKNKIDFYISIHPWKEVLDYGQKEFSWENFGYELCDMSNCKKLINFFKEMNEIKKVDINWKENFYFKNDIHFSAKGNEKYSEIIFNNSF